MALEQQQQLTQAQDGSSQPVRWGKAWQMTQAGNPSDRQLLKVVFRTVPAGLRPGQVLVKVASAALNPIDFKICEGRVPMGNIPLYPGFDFAGEVVAAAPDSGFTAGQEVFGDSPNMAQQNPKGGTLSEFIIVDKSEVALKPASLTSVEASGLPLVGQTVLDCLTKAEAPSGARVLILGASGGVGTVAVQICKARGHHVVGVCSAKNRDLVMSLGADEAVDYKEHDWGTYLADKKVDIVFDFAPSSAASVEAWDKATRVMKLGGKFITISGPDPEGRLNGCAIVSMGMQMLCRNWCSGFKYHFVMKMTTAEKLQELAKLVEDKKLKPVVEKAYPFSEAPAAYAHLMSGRAIGKICVTVPK